MSLAITVLTGRAGFGPLERRGAVVRIDDRLRRALGVIAIIISRGRRTDGCGGRVSTSGRFCSPTVASGSQPPSSCGPARRCR